MSSYNYFTGGLDNDSSVGAARTYDFFGQTAKKQEKNKSSSFLDAIGSNPEAVGTFAQMLSAAGGRGGRDRGYNQSGGFGGYGGSSRMSGSDQFMSDLGGTPGYSSSSLFMPDGQGGWSGGVGGYGGKRTTGQKLAAGAGGALTGALAGAKAGSALGPHGALIGGGLGFLSGFLG